MNNKVTNMLGTNREASLNNRSKKLLDFCTFNNLKIMKYIFQHKGIHKFTWEASMHKSIIAYFTTNIENIKCNTRH